MTPIEFMKRLFAKPPARTFESAVSVVDDYLFDVRHKLDTRAEVAIDDLDISQEDRQHADKYKPTRSRYFRKIMSKLDLPRDGVFVDVGSGKGRVLLLAAEHGFDRVVGLEISPALCQIAERNTGAFSQRNPTSGSIDVICTNILKHQLQGDETVFFLYSPFDELVTARFLDMVKDSLNEHPRDICLIIDEFRFPELLADDSDFEHTLLYEYGSAVFHVYSHVGRATIENQSPTKREKTA